MDYEKSTKCNIGGTSILSRTQTDEDAIAVFKYIRKERYTVHLV